MIEAAYRKHLEGLPVAKLVSVKLAEDVSLPCELPGKAGEVRQVAESVAKTPVDAKPPKAS